MKIKTLASGSTGNAYLVNDGETTLLLECGIPYRKLQAASDYSLSEVVGCLVTHEHNDHARAMEDLLRVGIPVYCSAGTASAKQLTPDFLPGLHADMAPQKSQRIGSFAVLPLTVEHDAAEPLGWLIRSMITGERLLFVTDTCTLDYDIPGLNYIMIECNYLGADVMAQTNAVLAERVIRSHMSLDECLRFLRRQELSQVQSIYLLHISSSHGNPEVMRKAVAEATGKLVLVAGQERGD